MTNTNTRPAPAPRCMYAACKRPVAFTVDSVGFAHIYPRRYACAAHGPLIGSKVPAGGRNYWDVQPLDADTPIPAFDRCTRAHLRAMSRGQLIAYGAWNDHGNGEWDNAEVMADITTPDLRAMLIAQWNDNVSPAELAAADAAEGL